MAMAMAAQLQAFSLDAFGYTDGQDNEEDDGYEPLVSKEAAEIAAGAIVWASSVTVDELFRDLARFEEDDAKTVAESDNVFMVLEDLPERYVLQYDVLFVRRLITTAVTMTGRLAQPGFMQLSCVAEELLMRLLLVQAEATADLFGLLNDEVSTALEVFAGGVYEDMDHEWLYEPAADGIDEDPAFAHLGIAPMGINNWFKPFNEGRFVHPYASNGDEPAPGGAPE